MSTAKKEIILEDLGPIVGQLILPIVDSGCITVIRGSNGAGKSIALEAIGAALKGSGSLSKRDGASTGRLEGLGVTLTVRKSTQRQGELECSRLESEEDVGTVIDPRLVSPEAADAKRIKALVRFTGTKADPSIFYELAGGQQAFEAICRPPETDDILILASRIKKDFESAARQEEAQIEHQTGHAKAFKESVGDLDLNGEANEDKLRNDMELAIREEARIKAEAESADKTIEAARLAQDALEDAAAEYKGLTSLAIEQILIDRQLAVSDAAAEIQKAEETLRMAKSSHAAAVAEQTGASEQLTAAKNHEKTLAAWKVQVEKAAQVKPIDQQIIAAATNAVTSARSADHLGVKIRAGRTAIGKAEEAASQAKQHAKRSEQLRQAAAGTDGLLSSLVAKLGSALKVKDGRLIYPTTRGDTFFADLSDGERAAIIFPIAIQAVGKGGVLPIGQSFWESLDLTRRKALRDLVANSGVIFITAEADHDVEGQPIRAEVFQGKEGTDA